MRRMQTITVESAATVGKRMRYATHKVSASKNEDYDAGSSSVVTR